MTQVWNFLAGASVGTRNPWKIINGFSLLCGPWFCTHHSAVHFSSLQIMKSSSLFTRQALTYLHHKRAKRHVKMPGWGSGGDGMKRYEYGF
jgi:hypothetical protein